MNNKIIIKGKTAFILFIITSTLIILTVWLTGLDIHRTIANNAIYSLSIITLLFSSFVTIGLYKGVGLIDNVGSIKNKLTVINSSGLSPDTPHINLPFDDSASDGWEGAIVGILLWLGVLILTILLSIFFETIVYTGFVLFTGIFYWIFYRATRLVLRYSKWTKNNLLKSIRIGLSYSLLYSSWTFLIIWLIDYFKK